MLRPNHLPRYCFTLVELLCVFSIIALLGAILFTAFSSSRRRSTDTVCISNLRQIGAAIRMYQSDYDDMPYELKDLNPSYISDARVFRCPVWVALYGTAKPATIKKADSIFSMYSLLPAMQRSSREQPDEGAPSELLTPWEEVYQKRGEDTPLVTCQYHDPMLLSRKEGQATQYMGQMTWIVLRVDGSTSKKVAHEKNGMLSWQNL